MMKRRSSLLDIPEFLQRDYDPLEWLEKYIPPKDEPWWMPDLQAYKDEAIAREERKKEIQEEKREKNKRKLRKQRIEYDVLDLISRNNNTYGKIRTNMHEGISDSEIRTGLRRLMKQGKVIKPSRRTYKVQL